MKRVVLSTPLLHALTFVCALVFPGWALALDLGTLKGEVFGSGTRALVVILHGDSGPGSHYSRYAAALAKRESNTTVVVLTRPAFTGPNGRSPGQNPKKDHFTPSNNKRVAQSIEAMKQDLSPKRVIVVGFSGGAGQTGTIVGRFPGIIDVAILAACPCDVPNWRIHRRGRNGWKQSQSPHRYAGKIPRSTRVDMITGSNDENTLPKFALRYYEIAKKAGTTIAYYEPKGVTHSWSALRPHIDAQVRKALR